MFIISFNNVYFHAQKILQQTNGQLKLYIIYFSLDMVHIFDSNFHDIWSIFVNTKYLNI